MNATLVNLTINGINNSNIYLDNYIFDAVSAPGCNNTNCNNCPAADTDGCYKDLDTGSGTPDTVQECDSFTTGGTLCQCISIHITDPAAVHQLRQGKTLQFSIEKLIAEPAESPCS